MHSRPVCVRQLPDLVRFALACAASGIGMALVSIRLTCYGALCAPLIGVLASYIGTHVGRLERAHQEQMGRATAIATEGFASARVLKAFGQEEWMAHRFGVEVDACASYALRAMRVHKVCMRPRAFPRSFPAYTTGPCTACMRSFLLCRQ